MQLKITSNINGLKRLLQQTPLAMGDGVKSAMDKIKNDWHGEALPIAPIDTGKLRNEIKSSVDGSGIDRGVTIESNSRKKGFNYSYYIHEGHMRADGKRLRTPGTIEDYLVQSANPRVNDWMDWLEEETKRELQQRGW